MIHQATVGIQPMTRLSPLDHRGKGHPMGIHETHETKEIEQGKCGHVQGQKLEVAGTQFVAMVETPCYF